MRMQVRPWPCSVGWESGIALSSSVGHSRGSDPVLLWLWCRLAATAPVRSLAQEPPCAMGAALKKDKKQTKKQKPKTSFKPQVIFPFPFLVWFILMFSLFFHN